MSVWTIKVQSQGPGPPTELRIRKFLKGLLRNAKLRCVDYGVEKPAPESILLKPKALKLTA